MRKQAQKKPVSRRLLLMLGISVLLHGLLLSQWPTSTPILEFTYQPHNLALNLEPIEIVGQQPQTQHKKATTDSDTKSVTPRQALRDKAVITKHIPLTEHTKGETTDNNHTSRILPQENRVTVNNPTMNRARILSQIRHDLSQHFYYPPLARRKGMQGTVLLGFGISGQGAIRNIRVVKSSGYAILDLAAQDAMQRLDKLNWYAALMHGKDMDLELPVIFRLTEG
jgi:protein TonB